MKKRIREVVNMDGTSRFYPEEKILFWWFGDFSFGTKEEAIKWAKYNISDNTKIHHIQ